MSPDIFLRQTFGDPRKGEAVYDGMIDRGRGGGEGYGGSLSFLRKDQSLSRGFICGFLLLLCFFFFHVREGHYALLRAFSYENEVL